MNELIGKSVEDAVAILKDTPYKIVQYFSNKQKKFDTEIVIRVTEENGVVVLTTGNFLINI